MNLQNQIKQYRVKLKLSQEDLADKVYVTRQTISNWETGKNYPDINSLLLLSSLFDISLDELVKGDLMEMKKIIDSDAANKMKQWTIVYLVGFLVIGISAYPLFLYLEWWGALIWALLVSLAMIPAIRLEKMKKKHNIQTYREIAAFMDGKKLDELEVEKKCGNFKASLIKIVFGAIVGFLLVLISYAVITLLK